MKTQDIIKMGLAYQQVQEKMKKHHPLDVDKDGDIEADDLADLRAGKHKKMKKEEMEKCPECGKEHEKGECEMDEKYVSHAQRKAVWANRADDGKGHPDKKKAKKEEVEEAMAHGNQKNGSPEGEGLSPSAKKELARKTPINPGVDEPKVDALNFKTFKNMTKKSPMRPGDNASGDKNPVK